MASQIVHAFADAAGVALTEQEFVERGIRRSVVLQRLRGSFHYTRALVSASVSDEAAARLPRCPDPSDRSLSKRQWEREVQRWRRELAHFVSSDGRAWSSDAVTPGDVAEVRDASLVWALRCFGLPVQPVGPGPLWVLRDGNTLLQPFGFHLQSASLRTGRPGCYLLGTRACVVPLVLNPAREMFDISTPTEPRLVDLMHYWDHDHVHLYWIANGPAHVIASFSGGGPEESAAPARAVPSASDAAVN